MTATKSIFDKSYMIKAQAIKAAEKEFGADWAESYEIAARPDIVPARWAVKALPAPVVERVPGYSHCPHCNIDLENGVGEHMQEVNGSPIRHEKHEFECLACGEEFGPLIDDGHSLGDAMANATMAGVGLPQRLSSIKSPVKRVWDIADSMPKASRKDVVAECIRQGVGAGTARTQYQAWFKASQESKREDIRQPYEKVQKDGE